jgi:subtilisin family serine protease
VGVEADGTIDPAALAASGGRIVDSIPALHLAVVDGVTDPTPLVGAAGVRYVERSFEVTLDVRESAPFEGALADAEAAATPEPAWVASGIQWDLRAMRADRTIAAGDRGAGINVCIIDSGIDELHQELAGKVVASESFVPNSPAALDSNGHGTHVAGSTAARGVVMSGVAPDANLMTAKVFDATGGTPVSRVLNAMRWCADNGAHVVNVSLGGIRFLAGRPVSSNPDVQSYTAAVRYANERGTVVVVAAGNENLRLPNGAQTVVPAQVPGTIIVGATGPVSRQVPVRNPTTGAITSQLKVAPPGWDPLDPTQVVQGPDGRAFYSNFGTAVDVFAPGGRGGSLSLAFALRITTEPVVNGLPGQTARVQHGGPYDNIYSACSRFAARAGSQDVGGVPGPSATCRTAPSSDRYASLAGTSMAAPHVAGLAAVVYEALGGTRSAENRARVEQCIRTTTDDIGASTTFGSGRVNAERAVACARS